MFHPFARILNENFSRNQAESPKLAFKATFYANPPLVGVPDPSWSNNMKVSSTRRNLFICGKSRVRNKPSERQRYELACVLPPSAAKLSSLPPWGNCIITRKNSWQLFNINKDHNKLLRLFPALIWIQELETLVIPATKQIPRINSAASLRL